MLDLSPLFDRAADAVNAFAEAAKKPSGSTSTAVRLVEVLAPWRDARKGAWDRLELLTEHPANVDAELFKASMTSLHGPTHSAASSGLERLAGLARALDHDTFTALSPDGYLDATRIDVATRAWRSIGDAADALICAGQMASSVMNSRSSLITAKTWTEPFIRTATDAAPPP